MSHVDDEPEIHLGDVGTTYEMEIYDENLVFDPTSATVKQLIFKMPGRIDLYKTATIVPEGSPVVSVWLMVYQVQPADGAGSPPGEFHAATGALRVQPFLQWANGHKYHGKVVTHDVGGSELRVYKNLG